MSLTTFDRSAEQQLARLHDFLIRNELKLEAHEYGRLFPTEHPLPVSEAAIAVLRFFKSAVDLSEGIFANQKAQIDHLLEENRVLHNDRRERDALKRNEPNLVKRACDAERSLKHAEETVARWRALSGTDELDTMRMKFWQITKERDDAIEKVKWISQREVEANEQKKLECAERDRARADGQVFLKRAIKAEARLRELGEMS